MITLAFYKGRAANRWHRVQDAAIRAATRSRYAHVELIAGRANVTEPAQCLSASGRDGGVRLKTITLRCEQWDLVRLDISPAAPARFIQSRIGAGYDYKGLLLSHVLAFGHHDEDRWFCSEICAAAIGIANPHKLSPQLLFDLVTWGSRQRDFTSRARAPCVEHGI